MTVKQISVFIENKPGCLAAFADVLSKNALDMRAMSIAESVDFGILRIIAADSYNTARVLQEEGYVCSITSVLAAAIPDEPGSLCKILALLDQNEINLEYTYAFITKQEDMACFIFRVADADITKACELLGQNGIRLICQNELTNL